MCYGYFQSLSVTPLIFSVVIKCSLTSLFLEDPYLVSSLLRQNAAERAFLRPWEDSKRIGESLRGCCITLLVPDPLQISRRLALLKGLCRSTNNEACSQRSSPLMVTRHLPLVSKSKIHWGEFSSATLLSTLLISGSTSVGLSHR